MKKILFFASILLLTKALVYSQTTKVLYFKSDLSCCMAKACNSLQNDISIIVSENFSKDVSFEVIKISDPVNVDLVSNYNAKSQTVVIEKYDKKGKFIKFVDISPEVKTFGFNKDKTAFTEILKTKIEN